MVRKSFVQNSIQLAKTVYKEVKGFAKTSETAKVRKSLARYCVGNGLDLGYGGDPISQNAICLDLPAPYAQYRRCPQHLSGDARDLRWFRDGCLDFVYSSHLLEDFEDTIAVLQEWIRVIKPGGMLVLYLPDEQAYRKYCREKGKPPNVHHKNADFSLDFVKDILKKRNDLEIIHEKFPSGIYSFELVARKI